MSDDDTVVREQSNRDLVNRIATRAEDYALHRANVRRARLREDSINRFKTRIAVAASVGREWRDVRDALILVAVTDLYEALLITEGTSA